MTRPSAATDVVTRPVKRYNPGRVSLRERLLFGVVLAMGGLSMIIAGQFALQMPRTWQIDGTNMESQLNPNEVYALYHKEGDLYLAPIRTDIPNLLSTPQDSNPDPGSYSPPAVVRFNAPARIATTTPFAIAQMTATLPAASPTVPGTPLVVVPSTTSTTEAPTQTPLPTNTPLPTSTRQPTRVPTQIPTRIPTRVPTRVPTRTSTVIPSRTPTPVLSATVTSSPTHTPVHTLTYTATATSTHTHTPTATPTATDTLTPTPTHTNTPTATITVQPGGPCPINEAGNYDIPVGGCTLTYATTYQGGIFSLDLIDPGSLTINWYGLLENQTSGICAAQTTTLTKGKALSNIAAAKGSTVTMLNIGNPTTKMMSVQILIGDWTTGGCNSGQ